MIEKALHAGNIGASCIMLAEAARAADLAFGGGTVTAISVCLSTVALFKKGQADDRSLASSMAKTADAHLDAAGVTPDQRKIALQMLGKFLPDLTDQAAGNMDAAQIAANARATVANTANDPAHTTDVALTNFENLLAAIFEEVLKPATPEQAGIYELLRRTEVSGEAERLSKVGITEQAVKSLVANAAAETEDLEAAWAALQDLVKIAIEVQQSGQTPGNHGDSVDEALRQAADLARDGQYETAGDELDAAMAAEDAAHQARKTRLLEDAIKMARLAGSAERMAGLLIRQADLEAGEEADINTLRAIMLPFLDAGRDQGINFDLRLAIVLSEAILPRAETSDTRGTVLNELGIALSHLGSRETGTDRLEAAVNAFEKALLERRRDRVPLDWASTQNNLGNALRELGLRETGTDKLKAAVSACKNALLELTRDRVPLQWATTQNNLGNAMLALGRRESGTGRLKAAITAYKNALLEQTRDRVPLDWATTQNNLGSALHELGLRATRTYELEAATKAYENALLEWTRDRVPLQWATTQNNLGNALLLLGFHETGTDRLEAAASAFENALLERTRDRVPLDWAVTQNNLGNALQELGLRETGTDRLEAAVDAYENALLERTRDRVPLDWAMTQGNLANVRIAFFDKTGDAAHLDLADDHIAAAAEVFTEAGHIPYLQWAKEIKAKIAARRAGLGQA